MKDFRNWIVSSSDWEKEKYYSFTIFSMVVFSFYVYYDFSKNIFGNQLVLNLMIFAFIVYYEFRKKTTLLRDKLQFISFLLFIIGLNTVTYLHLGIRNKIFFHFYLMSPSILFILHFLLDKIHASRTEKLISFLLFTSINTYFVGFFNYPILYLCQSILIFSELIRSQFKIPPILFLVFSYLLMHLYLIGIEYNSIIEIYILFSAWGIYKICQNTNPTQNHFLLYPIILGFLIFIITHSINHPLLEVQKIASEEFNSNRVGSYAAMTLPWLIYSSFLAFKKRSKYLYFSFVLITLAALLVRSANSRAAILAIIFTSFIVLGLIYFQSKNSKFLNKWKFFTFAFPLLFLASAIFLWVNSISFDKLQNSLKVTNYSSLRYEIWTIAWNSFTSSPFHYQVFGTGAFNKDILPHFINIFVPDDLKTVLIGSNGKYLHSHNLYLEILLSFGLIGFSIFIYSLFVLPTKKLVNTKTINFLTYSSLATILIVLFHGTLDYLLDNVNYIYAIPIFLSFIGKQNSSEENKEEISIFKINLIFVVVYAIYFFITLFFLQYYHTTNKLLAKTSKHQMISFHCPNALISQEKVNAMNLYELQEIDHYIQSNNFFLSLAETKYSTFYASFYHAMFLKTKEIKYARDAEFWYAKCYSSHPYPKACERLRTELYENASWDINLIPKTKIIVSENPTMDLYKTCTMKVN